MATITTSEGWMTSFIYEQDLTSAYMNSLLYSMFRPGIYNANFILKSDQYNKSSASNEDGLSLLIKKGTTLIFSNDYINIYNQKRYYNKDKTLYRRSFTCNRGDEGSDSEVASKPSRFPLIIKCVAMSDIIIKGISQSAFSGSDMSCLPWSNEVTSPEVLYLCATMKYDQDGENDFDSIPDFFITRNNPYYGDPSKDSESDLEASRFFYYHTRTDYYDYSTQEGKWRIPDGSATYGNLGRDNMYKFMYLTIGALPDISPVTRESGDYNYFYPLWFKNHTFTARCLPEYRNNMIGSSNNAYPDFIIPYYAQASENEDTYFPFSRLYIDFKDVMNFGNIYNTSIDWEPAYKIANRGDSDYFTFNALSGVENEDYISYKLSDDDVQKLEDISSVTDNVSLIMDFTFAITKNVLNSEANLDGGEDIFSKDSLGKEIKNNKIKLINHREILGLHFPNMTDDEDDKTDYTNIIQYVQINNEGSSGSQIKLDICNNNSNRLLDLLKNNNILYRVIDKIRSNGDLNASEGESLIPVSVSFRILGKTTLSPSDWSNIPIVSGRSYKSVEIGEDTYYVINFVGDNITSIYSVNPLNALGLLDLEFKMTKLNPINIRTQDAYTVLPVID